MEEINFETDERPPSILVRYIDDSLEKPDFKQAPPPVPDGLPEIQQIAEDVKRFVHEDDQRLKYAILCYSMAHDGVADLRKMPVKYTKEEKNKPGRDYIGFPDFLESVGGNEDGYLRPEKIAATAKLLTEKDKKGRGPYLEYDEKNDVYRTVHEVVQDAIALSYGNIFAGHNARGCRIEFIYNFYRPADIITEEEKRKMYVEMFESTSNDVTKRFVKRLLEGYVKEVAYSRLFDSDLFKETFLTNLEKNEKKLEILQAVDKSSTPDKPMSFLYCLVAQNKPKLRFLTRFLQEFDKVKQLRKVKSDQVLLAIGAACRWGHFEVFQTLVDITDNQLPFDVLRKAVIGGDSNIVESLLRNQDWNQTQLDKAFEWACFYGSDVIYSTIRDRGANGSDVCLFESAFGGNLKIFMDLCQQGYDYETTFKGGKTVFHIAVENGSKQIVEYLLQRGVDPHVQTKSGQIPLLMAAGRGQDDVAELLLMIGGDPNIRDSNKSTALHRACAKGSYRLFERLLNVGGDKNALDKNGATILHKAFFGGNREIIDHLLKDGFELDTVDIHGNSVLHVCAARGHRHLLVEFVDINPALISTLNNELWNPVMYAAYYGQLDAFDFLARNGADIAQTTMDDGDILELARFGQAKMKENRICFDERIGENIRFGPEGQFEQIIEYLSQALKQ